MFFLTKNQRVKLHDSLTDHGGAACDGGLCALVEVVDRRGTHQLQFHVRMCVNATWEITNYAKLESTLALSMQCQYLCIFALLIQILEK
jgi:hypothetical protein